MILKALEAPNIEIQELIKQQRMRYESECTPLFLTVFLTVSSILTFTHHSNTYGCTLCGLNGGFSFTYSDPTSLSFLFFFLDRIEGDDDEPDLALLTTLDFAALKDVKETGVDYCHHFKAFLHNTPGLEPGYLPERDASYLLNGVGFLSSLASLSIL